MQKFQQQSVLKFKKLCNFWLEHKLLMNVNLFIDIKLKTLKNEEQYQKCSYLRRKGQDFFIISLRSMMSEYFLIMVKKQLFGTQNATSMKIRQSKYLLEPEQIYNHHSQSNVNDFSRTEHRSFYKVICFWKKTSPHMPMMTKSLLTHLAYKWFFQQGQSSLQLAWDTGTKFLEQIRKTNQA